MQVSPTILVVEDNEWSRDLLARWLLRRGYHVLLAVDGREGISKAKYLSPDLVIMDLSLPEIDGWEATRRLKADPSTREIPIVALTAHAMASDRQKAMSAGCDDYHTKPVDFDSLLRSIEAFLLMRSRAALSRFPAAPAADHSSPAIGDSQC
jgi:CheY-like chemotaxis protein